jgi:hypothetical protein
MKISKIIFILTEISLTNSLFINAKFNNFHSDLKFNICNINGGYLLSNIITPLHPHHYQILYIQSLTNYSVISGTCNYRVPLHNETLELLFQLNIYELGYYGMSNSIHWNVSIDSYNMSAPIFYLMS